MRFSLFAALVGLISGQELLVPVTDKVADTGCGAKF